MRNPEDADTTDRAGRGPICRHLGTEDDRSSYYSEPSRRHRCYLWWQRDRIDLAHQARFCFTEAHSVCPWLSISPPLSVEREGRILPLRPEAHDIAAPPSHRVFVIVIALWLWLRVAMGILGRRAAALAVAGWRWLRPVIARVARSLWARLKGGLLGLGHQLAEVLRQRRHSEPATLAEPAGTPIEAPQPLLEPAPASPAVVLVSHPQGILSPLRRLVKPPVITWRCSACEAINSGPSQVCHKCGRPSPEVEEQLMSSGDELLAKGLAGLKDKNEELAYACFVMACEASPDSELAWYWRAKTAPTLDEVIRCLERLLELTPGNAKVQADLNWALQRRQHEQARPVAVAAAPQPARPALRPKIVGEIQWWALQAAGVCTFALALALLIPYGLRLTDLPSNPQLQGYLALIPSVALPNLLVHPPNLPAFDVGPVLPLLLGLLLLHAAFVVVNGGGLGARVWTALLGGGAAALVLSFGTDPMASGLAVDLAAVAIATSLVGSAQAGKPRSG